MTSKNAILPPFIRSALASFLTCWFFLPGPTGLCADTDYQPAIRELKSTVLAEMAEWQIGGVSVALVDDQEVVYAAGYGEGRRDGVYRCGSISKLFTAVAVMQLVEAGLLDLDAPVESHGRGLVPVDPFTNGTPVTLRQLMSHRSGMIRESPIGGYLDPREPGLERTIESTRAAVLVNPPDTKTRYSNVGPSLAGRIVELVTGEDFAKYQKEHLFGPMRMSDSCWYRREIGRGKLVKAHMRVADGRGGYRRQEAPLFDLGTIPAGNLYTTAADLGRFVKMLLAGGDAPGGRVLKPETLREMFTPQLTSRDSGFGLGFMVSRFRERTCISHSGAVYGYSSSMMCLPEEKLGVVVLSNEDIVGGRIQKIAGAALSLMLKAKTGLELPEWPVVVEVAREELARFAGEYESESFWANLRVVENRLEGEISGQPVKFAPTGGPRFLADSRSHNGVAVVFDCGETGKATGFSMGSQRFTRVAGDGPALPREWRSYLGVYGPSFIPLVVIERNGHLYATTENMVDYRLRPINRHVFGFPEGMYADEYLVFIPGRSGKPRAVSMANMVLPRR